MASRKDINKPFLRAMMRGDMIPFTSLPEADLSRLRVLCSQMKEEGYRFEVRHNPDCNVTVVRRKSHDRV